VLLTIGYHQLEGKRLPLKKPLAVLEQEGSGEGLGYKVRSAKHGAQQNAALRAVWHPA
jgi:hypothetical protein